MESLLRLTAAAHREKRARTHVRLFSFSKNLRLRFLSLGSFADLQLSLLPGIFSLFGTLLRSSLHPPLEPRHSHGSFLHAGLQVESWEQQARVLAHEDLR